jgi:hypothetical protein
MSIATHCHSARGAVDSPTASPRWTSNRAPVKASVPLRREYLYLAHFFPSLSNCFLVVRIFRPVKRLLTVSPSGDSSPEPLWGSDCPSVIVEEKKTQHLSPSKQGKIASLGALMPWSSILSLLYTPGTTEFPAGPS